MNQRNRATVLTNGPRQIMQPTACASASRSSPALPCNVFRPQVVKSEECYVRRSLPCGSHVCSWLWVVQKVLDGVHENLVGKRGNQQAVAMMVLAAMVVATVMTMVIVINAVTAITIVATITIKGYRQIKRDRDIC